MAGRMKRHLYPVDRNGFIPFNGLIIIIAQSKLQKWFGEVMTQVLPAAPAGMIAMRMGNYSMVDRLPGVDIKATGSAIQSLIGKLDEQAIIR